MQSLHAYTLGCAVWTPPAFGGLFPDTKNIVTGQELPGWKIWPPPK